MEVNRNTVTTIIVSALTGLFLAASIFQPVPKTTTPYTISWTTSRSFEDGIQCPIPPEDRVSNYSGIQCVYAAIETLGRWAREPKLTSPPLTSRSECQGYSNPYEIEQLLNKLRIRYRQSYLRPIEGRQLIREAMRDGRGALFGVSGGKTYGHTMVMIHFDEVNDCILYIDNSDKLLKTRSMSMAEFNKIWDRWVLVIYADHDSIPYRIPTAVP